MHTIAVINQKGGVGKTATTMNVGGALVELGYRVLLVDLDPQGHLTEACGVPEAQAPDTLAQILMGSIETLTVEETLRLVRPWRDRLDLVPTNIDAFLLERQLYRARAPEYRLQHVLERLAQADAWDVCLIDCPPSLGVLTDNALVCADQALVPVQAEDSTLRALRLLLEQIKSARAELRTDIELLGMVVNLYDSRRGKIVTSVLDTLQDFPLDILATIEDRAAIREAWRAGMPVVEHAPDSTAAGRYRDLAKTLTGAEVAQAVAS